MFTDQVARNLKRPPQGWPFREPLRASGTHLIGRVRWYLPVSGFPPHPTRGQRDRSRSSSTRLSRLLDGFKTVPPAQPTRTATGAAGDVVSASVAGCSPLVHCA